MRGDQQAQQRVGCQRLQDGVQLKKERKKEIEKMSYAKERKEKL